MLEIPLLRLVAAASVNAGAVFTLAWLARRHGRGHWPALSALVLGHEGEDTDEPGQDLRFAAVVAAVVSGLGWVVALDARFRELPGALRALSLAMGFPIVAVLMAAVADVLARERQAAEPSGPAQEDPVLDLTTTPAAPAAPAPAPTSPSIESGSVRRPPSATREETRALIDGALAEVGAARTRTEDPAVRDGLASLEETLAEYGRLVDEDDADLDRIAQRVREATALAKACQDDGSEAFRVLGIRRDATPEQAKRVYRELAKLYHQDAALPGVDPERFKEITVAYERVRSLLDAAVAAQPPSPGEGDGAAARAA